MPTIKKSYGHTGYYVGCIRQASSGILDVSNVMISFLLVCLFNFCVPSRCLISCNLHPCLWDQLFARLEKWLKAQYQNYAAFLAQPLRQDQVM